jgi:hypothetical protein
LIENDWLEKEELLPDLPGMDIPPPLVENYDGLHVQQCLQT